MTTVLLITGVFLLVSGFATFATILLRRDRRESRRDRLESERRFQRFREKWTVALREEREAVESMKDLPWPELRRRHEEASGEPCECATRREAARAIYFAERKLQDGS